MNRSTSIVVLMALLAVTATNAQPVNTTVAGGGSWQSLGTMTYSTGNLTTSAGGIPGQMTGPYSDTSFGIMNEAGTPWFDGSDLSAQQYIQGQQFGNLGAAAPSPTPWGFATAPASGDPNQRFYNYGYGGTAAGSNFPTAATEQRMITVQHWDNPNQDIGGVATDGQQVWIATSAKISIDFGWGGDEMYFDMIGGVSGQQTKYRATVDHDASYTINGTGAYSGGGSGELIYSASAQNNDAGPGGAYQAVFWGLNANPPGGQGVGFDTSGSRTWNGTTLNSPSAGVPDNSIGTAISEITGMLDMHNISGANVVESGGSFLIQFDSTATLTQFEREFGDADGRFSYGPGMFGQVTYEVIYEKWVAVVPIPEPTTSGLVGLLLLSAFVRRR